MNFIPYGRQLIDDDDVKAVSKVLRSDFLTTGPKAQELEERISDFTGAKYSLVVSNGTAALHLASLALLEEGDLVLTTPNSFLATSNAILYAKAKPIFIDICEDGNIDLDLCEKELKKNPKIKAIYAVHFSGNPISQKKLKQLKESYDIKILEDCAHSIGAVENGVKAGSCENSDCAIFSFHPVKNLTTGEGGAILTNSKEIYEKVLRLRSHGVVKRDDIAPWYYEMVDLGFNYRITDFQCALGLSQFDKLEKFIARRREIAKRYDEAFCSLDILKPLYCYDGNSSYHLYVVQVDFDKLPITKIEFFKKMREKNIGLQLHYIPINKQPYYTKLGYGAENTPVMDNYYDRAFSLPMYPALSPKEQEYVIKTVFELLS